MNNEKNTKKLIEDILNNMGVRYDIVEESEDALSQKKLYRIKSPESGLLIGDNGETF